MSEKMIVIKKNLGSDTFVYHISITDKEIDYDKYFHVNPDILNLWVHNGKDWIENNSDIKKVDFYTAFWGFEGYYIWDIDNEAWYYCSCNGKLYKKMLENENNWIKECCKYL